MTKRKKAQLADIEKAAAEAAEQDDEDGDLE